MQVVVVLVCLVLLEVLPILVLLVLLVLGERTLRAGVHGVTVMVTADGDIWPALAGEVMAARCQPEISGFTGFQVL